MRHVLGTQWSFSISFHPKLSYIWRKKWQKLPLWAAQKSQKLIERLRYIGTDSVVCFLQEGVHQKDTIWISDWINNLMAQELGFFLNIFLSIFKLCVTARRTATWRLTSLLRREYVKQSVVYGPSESKHLQTVWRFFIVSYLTRSIFNISDQCLCKNVKLIHEEKSKIKS